jgi:hypothetical protein
MLVVRAGAKPTAIPTALASSYDAKMLSSVLIVTPRAVSSTNLYDDPSVSQICAGVRPALSSTMGLAFAVPPLSLVYVAAGVVVPAA